MLQHGRSLSMSCFLYIYTSSIIYDVRLYICCCFLFFFKIDMFADLELVNSWASLFLPHGRLSHLISEVLSSSKSHSTGVKRWDQGIVATQVQESMHVVLGSHTKTHASLYQFRTSRIPRGFIMLKMFHGSKTTYILCCKWIWRISIRTPWNPSWRCCTVRMKQCDQSANQQRCLLLAVLLHLKIS